jgi:hypothetical protein
VRSRVLAETVAPARRTVELSRQRHESGSVPAADEPPWWELEAQHEKLLLACSKIEAVVNASWWIDTRDMPGRERVWRILAGKWEGSSPILASHDTLSPDKKCHIK